MAVGAQRAKIDAALRRALPPPPSGDPFAGFAQPINDRRGYLEAEDPFGGFAFDDSASGRLMRQEPDPSLPPRYIRDPALDPQPEFDIVGGAASAAREEAREGYSPLSEDWGPIDAMAGLVTTAGGAIYDELAAAAGDEEARTRAFERSNPQGTGRWDRAAREIDEDVLSNEGLIEGFMAGEEARRAAGLPAPTLGERAGEFWRGMSGREARGEGAYQDVIADFEALEAEAAFQGGDDVGMRSHGLSSRMAREAANEALGTDAFLTGLAGLEFVPGVGLVEPLAQTGAGLVRGAARQPFHALGREVPEVLAPRPAAPREPVGPMTRDYREGIRDPLLGATGAYFGADALLGEGDDAIPATIAAGAGFATTRGMRGRGPLTAEELAIGDPLADIAPRAAVEPPAPQPSRRAELMAGAGAGALGGAIGAEMLFGDEAEAGDGGEFLDDPIIPILGAGGGAAALAALTRGRGARRFGEDVASMSGERPPRPVADAPDASGAGAGPVDPEASGLQGTPMLDHLRGGGELPSYRMRDTTDLRAIAEEEAAINALPRTPIANSNRLGGVAVMGERAPGRAAHYTLGDDATGAPQYRLDITPEGEVRFSAEAPLEGNVAQAREFYERALAAIADDARAVGRSQYSLFTQRSASDPYTVRRARFYDQVLRAAEARGELPVGYVIDRTGATPRLVRQRPDGGAAVARSGIDGPTASATDPLGEISATPFRDMFDDTVGMSGGRPGRGGEMPPPADRTARRTSSAPRETLNDEGARPATEAGTEADFLASLPTKPEQWQEVVGRHPWIDSPSKAQLIIMAAARDAEGRYLYSTADIANATGYSEGSAAVLLTRARNAGVPIPTRPKGAGGATRIPGGQRLNDVVDIMERAERAGGYVTFPEIGERLGMDGRNAERTFNDALTNPGRTVPPELAERVRTIQQLREERRVSEGRGQSDVRRTDLPTRVYHATTDTVEGPLRGQGALGEGAYASTDPDIADWFIRGDDGEYLEGANIVPEMAPSLDRYVTLDRATDDLFDLAMRRGVDPDDERAIVDLQGELVERYKREGFVGIHNPEYAGGSGEIVTWEARNRRAPWARMSYARRNSSDPFASIAGPVAVGGGAVGAAALLDEASAQEGENIEAIDDLLIDRSAALPSARSEVSRFVTGDKVIREYADGTHFAFRIDRSGAEPDIIPLGQVRGVVGSDETADQYRRRVEAMANQDASPYDPGWSDPEMEPVPWFPGDDRWAPEPATPEWAALGPVVGAAVGSAAGRRLLGPRTSQPLLNQTVGGALGGAAGGAATGSMTEAEDALELAGLGAGWGLLQSGGGSALREGARQAQRAIGDIPFPRRTPRPLVEDMPPKNPPRFPGSLEEDDLAREMDSSTFPVGFYDPITGEPLFGGGGRRAPPRQPAGEPRPPREPKPPTERDRLIGALTDLDIYRWTGSPAELRRRLAEAIRNSGRSEQEIAEILARHEISPETVRPPRSGEDPLGDIAPY